MTRVDQTILASDPAREGNCVAACVATFFDEPLSAVPHFIEMGQHWRAEGQEEPDRIIWWAMFCGYVAGKGLWPIELDSLAEGEVGELLFVAGPSVRGVEHQTLYRDGELWHDPHPSKAGLLEVTEVLALRRHGGHDHTPTVVDEVPTRV